MVFQQYRLWLAKWWAMPTQKQFINAQWVSQPDALTLKLVTTVVSKASFTDETTDDGVTPGCVPNQTTSRVVENCKSRFRWCRRKSLVVLALMLCVRAAVSHDRNRGMATGWAEWAGEGRRGVMSGSGHLELLLSPTSLLLNYKVIAVIIVKLNC